MFLDLQILISSPTLLAQAVVNGVVIGALFALSAYGIALLWGVMSIINIAQGDFVILGGYIAYTLHQWGAHPLWGVPVAAVLLYLLGWALYRTVIFRVVGRDLFTSILATFGISIMIQQLMNQVFGSDVRVAEAGLGELALLDNELIIPWIRLVAFAFAVVAGLVLVVFMTRTTAGRLIRATAQNARAARILGVDTGRVYAMTFGINAALCGVAGALVATTFAIHPYIGLPYTVRSFMVVVLAGLGNIPGVLGAAAGLGVAEELVSYAFGTEYRLAFVFALLVVVLVWRNQRLAKRRLYLR